MEKIDSDFLDFNSFKQVTIDNPEILDFYDIFNNKISENMTIMIHRQILRRLNGLSSSLEFLIEKLNSFNKNKKGITLSFKTFIEKAIKKESLLKDGILTNKLTDYNNSTNNYFICNNTLNETNINNMDKNNKTYTATSSFSCNINSGKNFASKDTNISAEGGNKAEIANNDKIYIGKNDNLKKEFNKNSKRESTNFFEDKLLLSFDMENSIKNKKDETSRSNRMFSISKKINVPIFPDDEDDEEVEITEDDNERNESEQSDDKSESRSTISIKNKTKNQYKGNNSNIINEFNNESSSNTISNNSNNFDKENDRCKQINNKGKEEAGKFKNNLIKAKFSLKDNYVSGKGQNILVNNINNINNINIVSNDITNIQNLNNLNDFNLINKKTSIKLNSGLPPIYNFGKDQSFRNKSNEDSIHGN